MFCPVKSCLCSWYQSEPSASRQSPRDIEVNLRAQSARLYQMGFRCKTITRNTLSNANAMRP